MPDYTSKGRPHKGLWHPHNIIVKGRANGVYILRYVIQCLITLCNVTSILLTMYFAHLAGVNTGIMTAIWGVQPLFAALLDYLIYSEPFLLSYGIGILMMIACAVLISFKKPEMIVISPD